MKRKKAEFPFFFFRKKSFYRSHNKEMYITYVYWGCSSSSISLQFHAKVSNDRILQYRKFSRIVIIIINIIVSIGVYITLTE